MFAIAHISSLGYTCAHTARKLFYEKCFVSKDYHNIQTYLPFLV